MIAIGEFDAHHFNKETKLFGCDLTRVLAGITTGQQLGITILCCFLQERVEHIHESGTGNRKRERESRVLLEWKFE